MSISSLSSKGFSCRVLSWFERHGRKDLPWQIQPDAYRVWVSEIMLQQTQVKTVIPYYQRFMAAFPDVASLAAANQDSVLQHWSGLGYYARAHNLHRSAQIICEQHDGCFPSDFDAVLALPGIGRSTAGAILSLALGQRHGILDGNVKRVLARCFCVEGWPGKASVAKQLWQLVEQLTPPQQVAQYNQAMMDLGATLCRRGVPDCPRCPLKDLCCASKQGVVSRYPHSRSRAKLPQKNRTALVIEDMQGRLLLQKRPPIGIWSGLWSFPEMASDADSRQWLLQYFPSAGEAMDSLPAEQHRFSHYQLELARLRIRLKKTGCLVLDGDSYVWYKPQQATACGLAAPVKRYLQELSEEMR